MSRKQKEHLYYLPHLTMACFAMTVLTGCTAQEFEAGGGSPATGAAIASTSSAKLRQEWEQLTKAQGKELKEAWSSSTNTLTGHRRLEILGERQSKEVADLVSKIEKNGIDNWRLILRHNGLTSETETVLFPKLAGEFLVCHGYQISLFITTRVNVMREGVKMEAGYELPMPFDGLYGPYVDVSDLGEANLEQLDSVKEGENVYLSIEPEAFSIKNYTLSAEYFEKLSPMWDVIQTEDSEVYGKLPFCIEVKDPERMFLTRKPRENRFDQRVAELKLEAAERKKQLKLGAAKRFQKFVEAVSVQPDGFNDFATITDLNHASAIASELASEPDRLLTHDSFPNLEISVAELKKISPKFAFYLAAQYAADSMNVGHENSSTPREFVQRMQPLCSRRDIGKRIGLADYGHHTDTIDELARESFRSIRWDVERRSYLMKKERLDYIQFVIDYAKARQERDKKGRVNDPTAPPSTLFAPRESVDNYYHGPRPRKPDDWLIGDAANGELLHLEYLMKVIEQARREETIVLF
jgi:hypothetical protein